MDHVSVRPLSSLGSVDIDDLSSSTLEAVADKLAESSTFEELVYRESEMDTLFSLVDIALATHRGRTSRGGGSTTDAISVGGVELSYADLVALRDAITEAHDLTHDQQVTRASSVLRGAAQIVARVRAQDTSEVPGVA